MSLIAYSCLATLAVLAFTGVWVLRYARMGTPYLVYACVFVSWFLTFSSLSFVLPLDLVPSAKDQLTQVWNFIYWTSFLLTWLVIPLIMEFYNAGEFTVKGKLLYSLKFNMKLYGLLAVLFVAFLIYLAATSNVGSSQVLGFFVAVSNTWGLLLSVFLLGYGLVEMPKWLWVGSERKVYLRQVHFSAVEAHEEYDDATIQLGDAMRLVQLVDGKIPESDPLRSRFQEVQELCPLEDEEVGSKAGKGPRVKKSLMSSAVMAKYEQSELTQELQSRDTITLADLAKLHLYVKDSLRYVKLAKYHWSEVIEKSDELTELIEAAESESPPTLSYGSFLPGLAWRWRVHWKPMVFRWMSIVGYSVSIVLLWSEATMFASIDLSPFGLAINAVRHDNAAVQIVAMIPLVYLSCAALFSMWQLKLFRFYNMRHGRRTEENSLLFNASWIQRLIAPLGYNFVTFTRVEGTAFQEVIGQMDAVPFFGSSFNVYFPIMAVLLAGASWLGLFGRIMGVLGMEYFDASSAESSEEVVAEGRHLIEREKRRMGLSTGGRLRTIGSKRPARSVTPSASQEGLSALLDE